jgi:hypothetical protein
MCGCASALDIKGFVVNFYTVLGPHVIGPGVLHLSPLVTIAKINKGDENKINNVPKINQTS